MNALNEEVEDKGEGPSPFTKNLFHWFPLNKSFLFNPATKRIKVTYTYLTSISE